MADDDALVVRGVFNQFRLAQAELHIDGKSGIPQKIEAFFGNRIADEDAARDAYLREALKREPIVGELCKRGHNDWMHVRNGKHTQRKCKTCHRERMAAARAAGRAA